MKYLTYYIFLSLLLFTACTANKKLDSLGSLEDTTSAAKEDTTKLPEPKVTFKLDNVELRNSFRELYIAKGAPIELKLEVEGIEEENLVFNVLGVQMKVQDKRKGHYVLYPKYPNTMIEISARDTSTGFLYYETYILKQLPAPDVYFGIVDKAEKVKVEDFKRRARRMVVDYKTLKTKLYCEVASFKMIKISKDGKRQEAVSTRARGACTPEMLLLLDEADRGDLFILTEIKTPCTTQDASSRIYMLE